MLPDVGFVLPTECSVKDVLRVSTYMPLRGNDVGPDSSNHTFAAVDGTQPPNANTLSPKVVKYLAAQVLMAMVHTHAKGILWGDAKPANMVLMEDFTLRLIDIGETTSNPRRKHDDSDFVRGLHHKYKCE